MSVMLTFLDFSFSVLVRFTLSHSSFQYSNAEQDFADMDHFIALVMSKQQENRDTKFQKMLSTILDSSRFDRINLFYSNPEYYTKRKYNEYARQQQLQQLYLTTTGTTTSIPERPQSQAFSDSSWELKRDDFFPYGNCDLCYWTGFYSSRVSFKRLERVAAGILLASRQINTLLKSPVASQWRRSSLVPPRGCIGHCAAS